MQNCDVPCVLLVQVLVRLSQVLDKVVQMISSAIFTTVCTLWFNAET